MKSVTSKAIDYLTSVLKYFSQTSGDKALDKHNEFLFRLANCSNLAVIFPNNYTFLFEFLIGVT